MNKTTRKRSRRANITITEESMLPNIVQNLVELLKLEAHIGVEGDADTAMIAGIHEYGSLKAGIPARSFIGTGRKKSAAAVTKLAKSGIIDVVEGKEEPRELIRKLGETARKKTLNNFNRITSPALSMNYAKRKEGNKILQDEETLRDSIVFKIVRKGEGSS